MLTIKSNFNSFRDRLGQEYTDEDLTRLASGVLSADIVNFRRNDDTNMGRGFPSAITSKFIDKIAGTPDSILIINDISLHMTKALLEAGYKRKNIYLAYGRWIKNGKPCIADHTVLWLMKNYIKANFNEAFNVISLEDIFMAGKSWGLIIANPPYGKIGANITKNIIDNVDFDEYVNLLPANDYKRNTTKDLYNYQSDMEAINDGFADAAVTTHLAKIHKNKANNMTLDEFERSQYIDPQLDKYFNKLAKQQDTFTCVYKPKLDWFREHTPATSLYINKRDIAHEHLAYSKACNAYLWNTNQVNADYIISNAAKSEQALGNAGDFTLVIFNTAKEKENCAAFIYSELGFKFISKVLTALNIDSYCSPNKFIPKVDWARSWTVEEILKNYGYTDEEVQAVMDDLKNFKGMDD